MKFTSLRSSAQILILFLCVLSLPSRGGGAHSTDAEKHHLDLDALATTLATGLRTADVKSVTVADLVAANGRGNDLTWYLSGRISDALRKDIADTNGLRFVSRGMLTDSKLTAAELSSPEALAHIGAIWGVAAIVTGTVEIYPDQYTIKAIVRRVSDGSAIATADQNVPRLRFLDLLLPEGTNEETAHLKTIGVDGVTAPVCVYCPIPGYSDDALAAKVQTAKVTLTITVSTKGEPIKVVLDKNPGFGLGEKAIEDVSEWKFRPAMQNGKPVTVAVPVEVTFNLART
jgi:TonB family protein